jgi:hypothetical protein
MMLLSGILLRMPRPMVASRSKIGLSEPPRGLGNKRSPELSRDPNCLISAVLKELDMAFKHHGFPVRPVRWHMPRQPCHGQMSSPEKKYWESLLDCWRPDGDLNLCYFSRSAG